MKEIVIISDSTCDLSKEQIKENNIIILPLHVSFPNETKDYHDGVDITAEEVYEKAEANGKITLPKTGALNVVELINAFSKVLKEGKQLIFTGIGSGLSSTYQNALIAKETLNNSEDIEIVDSQNLSTGIGLLVLKMCKFRNEGFTLKEIKSKVEELVPKVSTKFCIDRLDYLYEGGRCSGMTKIIAHALKIHPIAKVINNKLSIAKLPRGKYANAVDLQIEEFKKDLPNIDMDCVFITHSGRIEGFDKYVYDKLKDYVPEGHLHITVAGSTICSHCGPKTIGILYILNK